MTSMMKAVFVVTALTALTATTVSQARDRWSAEKAMDWQAKTPWLRGSNFVPSSAANQLEMWQPDTFDPQTIDRELGFAAALGFNSMRVFLHHLPYEADRDGVIGTVWSAWACFCLSPSRWWLLEAALGPRA